MTDRSTFLNYIRQRLGHEPHFSVRDPGPVVPQSTLADHVPVGELIEHFTCMVEDVGGHVACVPNAHAARAWLIDFVTGHHMERAVVSRDIPIGDVGTALADAGLAVTVAPAAESIGDATREAFRQASLDADVGVTGADCALADTGTLVLLAGAGMPRIVSLLPPVHVAVIRTDQLLPNLPSLVHRLRAEAWPVGISSAMTLITGPSRTGDIEQTLSVGVHGPGELHVMIITEDP